MTEAEKSDNVSTDEPRQTLWIALGTAAFTIIIALVIALTRNSDPNAPAQSSLSEAPRAGKSEIAASVRPTFDTLRITPEGTGVVAGRMTAGARIELIANGQLIAQETADQRGEWVIIIDQPLSPGATEFDLRGYPADGGSMQSAAETAFAHVPERGKRDVLTVLADKAGERPSRVLQASTTGGGTAAPMSLQTIDYSPGDSPVLLSGQASDLAELRIYIDNEFAALAQPDLNGRWEARASIALSSDKHMIRLDQVAGDGKVLLRFEQPVTAGKPLNSDDAKAGVVIRPGNNLWQIARTIYGRGPQYTLIFRENSGQIKDPNLIYPGQMFALPSEK